jgi:site-specific DNA recombinase
VTATAIKPMRLAFYARVSTEEQQDPSLSIPRQLSSCERETAGVGEIVATYWDIETGRKDLDLRGNGADGDPFNVPTPRDGGIKELLRASEQPHPPFDAVIVESIDRLSRMTVDATHIERELERRDIALFASDEPMQTNATAILTRRVKQGVAEWFVRDLLEKSRRGMEESVRQGWHTGGPVPYGYMLEPHPHPNPHKAKEGKKKHKLIPDPVRAPIVLMIFSWYCLRGLGLGEICDKLNRRLDLYPPPKRNRKDENDLPQTWSKSQIHSMLRNPKYTGFNVWNRHDKRRGRPLIRPKDQWVWSPLPVHEPIVSRELFDQVEDRARRNEVRADRRNGHAYPQRPSHRSGRLYPLRGRVRCSLCERRMEGTHQKGKNRYRCRFVWNRGAVAADQAGHPRALSVTEEVVLEQLYDFMERRIFGPDRLRLLRHELARSARTDWHEHDGELARLKSALEKVNASLRRQTLRLEEHDDPDHPVVAAAKDRIEELSARRVAIDEAIQSLEIQRPDSIRPDEIEAMLAAVPDLSPALRTAAPEQLAALLKAFDVQVTFDKANRKLTLAATLTSELVAENEATAGNENSPTPRGPVGEFVHSGGGIRTRDLRVMSPTSYQTAPPRGVDKAL